MRIFFAVWIALVVASAAQAQDTYRIRPGDILRIEVVEDPSLNRSALVSPDGRISLPLAGSVVAAGRSVEQIQSELASGLASNFASTPNVFVAVERLAERQPAQASAPVEAPTISVYVIGAAERPGKLAVEPGTNLLQVFAEMGGFTRFAATKRVQLRRVDATGTEQVYSIDYDALTRGGRLTSIPIVAEGDVIVVPERRLFE